ncbi:MAG: hypothetical protein JWM98_3366 [Thermoleophilia bacterium]|nr:hypothetical protein [Thermoleophilia bacterium]
MQLTAPTSSPVPAVAPSPAVDFVQQHGWLTTGEHPAVAKLVPTGVDTVDVVVSDPWTEPGDAPDPDGEHMYADTAASVLEQAVGGVKLVVRTPDGYVGQPGYFSGDEQYFANSLPGLTSQAAEVGYDLDGDGTVGDEESAFVFPVHSQADVDRLDPLVRPTIGEYPTRFSVEG